MSMSQDELLGMRILIVDDEPVNIVLLEDMLRFSRYTQVVSTGDPRRVLGLCQERRPDLILLDLNMPLLDGFGVMKQLSSEITPGECVPILVLTADIGLETKRPAALFLGAIAPAWLADRADLSWPARGPGILREHGLRGRGRRGHPRAQLP